MPKKLNTTLAQMSVAIVFAAALAACGGGSDNSSASPAAGADTPAAADSSGGSDTSNNPGGGDSAIVQNFEPTSTVDVAVDATKENEYGGPPSVVSYVWHQSDGEVLTVNGQRYGDMGNDPYVNRRLYIDLGVDRLQLGFSGVRDGAYSWSMRPHGGKDFQNFGALLNCPDEGTNIAIPGNSTLSSSMADLLPGSTSQWPIYAEMNSCDDPNTDFWALDLESDGAAQANQYSLVNKGWDAAVFSADGWSPEPGVHWKAQIYRAEFPTGSAGAMEERGFFLLKILENGKLKQYVGFIYT